MFGLNNCCLSFLRRGADGSEPAYVCGGKLKDLATCEVWSAQQVTRQKWVYKSGTLE